MLERVKPVFWNRLLLAGTAVSLLWLSSLDMTWFLVGLFLPKHDVELVMQSAREAASVVEMEASSYLTCSEDVSRQYGRTFASLARAEDLRVHDRFQSNEKVLNDLTYMTNECGRKRKSILEYLKTSTQRSLVKTDNVNCTGILQSEITLAQVDSLMAQHTLAAEENVENLAEMANRRASYDQVYLHEKERKLQTVFHEANEKLTNGTAQVLHKVHEMNDLAKQKYESAYEAYENLEGRLAGLRATVDQFKKKYDSIMDRRIIRFAKRFVTFPSLDVSKIFYEAMKDRVEPMAKEKMNQILEEQEDKVENQVHNVTETYFAAYENNETTTGNQTNIIDTIFQDYLPPEDDIDGEVKQFETNQNSFRSKLSRTIANIPTPKEAVEIVQEDIILKNLTTATDMNLVHGGTEFETPWLFFVYEEFTFNDIMKKWSHLASLTSLFDILFRILQTGQILWKYLNIGKPLTPPIDVRDTETKSTSRGYQSKRNLTPYQRLALLVFHPATSGLLAFIGLWVIGTAAMRVYLPFFSKYMDGCLSPIHDPTSSNHTGTFLTENLATVANQYALNAGNKHLAQSLSTLNQEMIDHCTDQSKQVKLDFQAQHNRFRQLSELVTIHRRDIFDIQSCINEETNPFLYYQFHGDESRHVLFHTVDGLEDLVFNCSNLEISTVTPCPKPNQQLLDSMTWVAACQFEGLVHSEIFGWVLSGVVFTFLNIGRILFIRGIKNIMWFELSTKDQFTYVARIRNISPTSKDLEENSVPPEEEAKEKLHEVLTKCRKMGYVYLVGGVIFSFSCYTILHECKYLLSKSTTQT